jgi:mannose-6-phosphate isomerase-like protein (cupin superfamily)
MYRFTVPPVPGLVNPNGCVYVGVPVLIDAPPGESGLVSLQKVGPKDKRHDLADAIEMLSNFQEGTKVPVQYPPQLFDVANVEAHLINPRDTVKLAMLRGPDEVHDVSVFLEIWEPGGAQRPNSHSKSVETFLFLRGTGKAYCDEFELDVRAGQLLILPAGSLHRIESSTQAKLFAITTMAPDDGFAALVNRGETAPLDDDERAVLAQATEIGQAGPT